MVLDILREKLGARHCIHVEGSAIHRRHGNTADKIETTEAPAYDPEIHKLASDDAEFGPGIHAINRESSGTDRNKSFVNVIR